MPVGVVTFDNLFEAIFLSSYSVLIEELGFRMLPVLLPTAVYLLLSTRGCEIGIKGTLLALFKPRFFIEEFGKDRLNVPRGFLATLVALSSLVFAYAHIASGAWGWASS
ncbi:MAG: hypothetical protein H5T33_01815 [Candidatus Methanosuratus sp.]|nr:hypothetical protein [Candidatus Methanosuratincola sp.]